MAEYNRYSPYKYTPQSWYLGIYEPIKVLPDESDEIFIIPHQYHQKPWVLAKEKYGNERLYYIFALANMDTIQDPLYDFTVGTQIRIPTNDRIQRLLGSR